MNIAEHPEYKVDYAIICFHFLDNNKRFLPDECCGQGKGVLICYDLAGDRKDITFLLEKPFQKGENLHVWEGEEKILDSDGKSQIKRLIQKKENELIFYGMGMLD